MNPFNFTKPTSYELSEHVINAEGSLREIAEKIGISKAYACVLKKARMYAAAQVIDYWKSDELPFELVRQLMYLPRSKQLPYLRQYIRDTRDQSKPVRGKVRKRLLSEIKEERELIS